MTTEEFTTKLNNFVAKTNPLNNMSNTSTSSDDFSTKLNNFVAKTQRLSNPTTNKESISDRMDRIWVDSKAQNVLPTNITAEVKPVNTHDFINSIKNDYNQKVLETNNNILKLGFNPNDFTAEEKNKLQSGEYSINSQYNPNSAYSQKIIYTGDLQTKQDLYNNSNSLGKARMIVSDIGQGAKEVATGIGQGVEKGLGLQAIDRAMGISQEEAEANSRAFYNAKIGYTPQAEQPKLMSGAEKVGNVVGNIGRYVLISSLTGNPFASGAINGAIDAYSNYGTAEDIGRHALSGGIFMGATSGLANGLSKGGQALLSMTPLKNSIVANLGARTISNFTSAFIGDQLSNLPLKEEERKGIKDSLINAGAYTAFSLIGDTISTINASRNVKAQLADATEKFQQEFTQQYADAYTTANPAERVAKFETILQELDDMQTAIKQNQYIGASKKINSINEGINALKDDINVKIASTPNYSSNNLLGSGENISTNSLPSLPTPNLPNTLNTNNLPSLERNNIQNVNAPQNLPISVFAKAPNSPTNQLQMQGNEVIPNQTQNAQNGNTGTTEQNALKEQLTSEINSNKYLSTEEKANLTEAINSQNVTKETQIALKEILDTVNQEGAKVEAENLSKIESTKYKNYLKDTTELDKNIVSTAVDSVQPNARANGRRTKEQWLSVAKNLGQQIYDMTDSEIERYAYKTWQELKPNQKANLNRQGKGYVEFKSNEWIDAVKNTANEAKARTSLPIQSEQVSKLPTTNKNNLKQKQLEIIQKSNPIQDDYHTGIRTIEDIKEFKDTIDDDESFVWGDFSREDAIKAIEKGEVTVYSSYPIENGVFISTSQNQARDYAGNGKIYSKTIPLNDVAWINGDEGQYAKVPGKVEEKNSNKTLYHQTKAKSLAEMDKSLRRAGLSDTTMPTGIFLKDTDIDIGLEGKNQLKLDTQLGNSLEVQDRSELVRILNEDKKYRALREKTLKFEKEYSEVANKMSEEATTIQEIEEADKYLNDNRKQLEEYANEIQEEARKYLKSKGYDSVVINSDVGTNGRKTKSYLVFDKEQLSEVKTKASVKSSFSMPSKDNQGRTLTPQQQEDFKDSKVRDEKGRLTETYHGTNADFDVFDSSLTNFGDVSEGLNFFTNKIDSYPDSAMDYARNAVQKKGGKERIVKAYLNIKNPYIFDSSGYYNSQSAYDRNFRKIQAEYLSGDYDGIIVKDLSGKNDDILYAVENPNQIKIINDLPTQKNVENVQQMRYNENRGEENGREINKRNDTRRIQELFELYRKGETVQEEYSSATEKYKIRKGLKITQEQLKLSLIDYANKYALESFTLEENKLNDISKKLNMKIVFYKLGSNNIFQGLSTKDVIYIDSLSDEKIGNIFYHELVHNLRQNKNDIYIKGIQPIVDKIAYDFNYQENIFDYASGREGINIGDLDGSKQLVLAEEVVADTVASLYGELNNTHGLPQEIINDIKNAMDKILNNSENSNESSFSMPKNKLETQADKLSKLDYINPAEDLQRASEFVEKATEKDIATLEKMVEDAESQPLRVDLQQFGEKAKRKLDALKDNRRREIRYLREQVKQGTAEQSDITYVLKAEREVAKERVEETKQYFKEQKEREQERRGISKAGSDLLKIVKRLDKLKTTPDNRAEIDELIGDIDKTSKGITEKGKINLEKLKTDYEAMQENNPDFIPNKDIEKKISRLDRKHISDMSIDDIRDLTDVLRGIEHDIKNAKKEIGVEHAREIYKVGENIINEVRSAKGSTPKNAITNTIKKTYGTSTLSPKREFAKIGGWGNNEMVKQYQALEDGQTKQLDFQLRANKMFDGFAKQHEKEMQKWSGKKAEFIDTKILANGQRVRITPDMRMSLYLHSKNADNMKHIVNGGITLPNEALYKKGNYSEAYARSTVVKLTPTQVQEIIATMPKSEKQFANIAYDFFNGLSKEAINETSLILDGYEKATVDNYFPITTNKAFTRGEFESLIRDGTIEGMGMLKERTNASNPITLEDLTGVILRQIDNVSKYYGLAIPIRNFNAIYNTTTAGFGDSVKNAISQKWGKPTTDYIEKLMADLQGSKKQHDLFDAIKGNFAQATLALNVGVTAKQVASYPTAAATLGWKALGKGIKRATSSIKNISNSEFNDLIDKYTPYYWYRRQGNINTELGDVIKDKNFESKVPYLMNWIQSADMLTTGRLLWSASEEYVLEKNPSLEEGTDAFYREVASIYNRVILDTQPDYTILQRPDILRNDSKVLRSVTMFQTQRMQNYNIVYESIAEYKKALNDYKNNKTQGNETQLNKAKHNLINSVSGLIVAGLSIAGITALNNKLLDREDDYENDDGEKTFLSVIKGLGGDFLESMFGNILWGSELYSFLTDNWYDLQAPQLDTINGIIENVDGIIEGVSKALEKKNIIYLYKPFNEMAKSISTMFGIPLNNAEKYVGAILRKAIPNQMAQIDAYYNYSKNKTYFEGATRDGKKLPSAKDNGISALIYSKAYEAQKDLEGLKDTDGKTIDNSASLLKRKAIDEATPKLNQLQKNILYETFGVGKGVREMSNSEFSQEYAKLRLPTLKK